MELQIRLGRAPPKGLRYSVPYYLRFMGFPDRPGLYYKRLAWTPTPPPSRLFFCHIKRHQPPLDAPLHRLSIGNAGPLIEFMRARVRRRGPNRTWTSLREKFHVKCHLLIILRCLFLESLWGVARPARICLQTSADFILTLNANAAGSSVRRVPSGIKL
jgi:hypothetical protein